jgi:hypothetical protein
MNPRAQELRAEFIRSFVRNLIININLRLLGQKIPSNNNYIEKPVFHQKETPKQTPSVEEKGVIPSIMQRPPSLPAKMPLPFESHLPSQQQSPSSKQETGQEMVGMPLKPSVQELNEPPKQKQSVAKQPMQIIKPAAPKFQQKTRLPSGVARKLTIRGLARLEGLISDSTIQTIECPGPGKQVLVFRSGLIQTTNIALTLEEITDIMREISEKTRIPLISGIFKAALPEYLITAVMSEFVGTRFIITKKPQAPVAMPQ